MFPVAVSRLSAGYELLQSLDDVLAAPLFVCVHFFVKGDAGLNEQPDEYHCSTTREEPARRLFSASADFFLALCGSDNGLICCKKGCPWHSAEIAVIRYDLRYACGFDGVN